MVSYISAIFYLQVIYGLYPCDSCSQFKSGEFRYESKENKHWKVTRSDRYQTEASDSLKVKFTAKITWISKCKYRLEYVDASEGQEFIIGKIIEAEIVETSDNKFKVKSITSEGESIYSFKKIE